MAVVAQPVTEPVPIYNPPCRPLERSGVWCRTRLPAVCAGWCNRQHVCLWSRNLGFESLSRSFRASGPPLARSRHLAGDQPAHR